MRSISYKDLPNHIPGMPIRKRAAQFAPFDALTGFSSRVAESARETTPEIHLADDRIEELNQILQTLQEYRFSHASVRIVYFVPDSYKPGGKYLTFVGKVNGVDEYRRELVLSDKKRIQIKRIIDIEML